MIPTAFFFVQVLFFVCRQLSILWQPTGCVNSNTSHTACIDAHTSSAHHIALIPCSTSVAQGQRDCVPKIVVSFHLSRAMSLAPHRTPSTSSSTFSSVPGLRRLLTSRSPCADPRERWGDGYTDPEPLTRRGRQRQSHWSSWRLRGELCREQP